MGEKDEYFQLPWRTNVIPNVKHFIQKMGHNKITTRGNLQHRGIVVPSKSCVLCKEQDETIQYLFLNSKVSSMVQ